MEREWHLIRLSVGQYCLWRIHLGRQSWECLSFLQTLVLNASLHFKHSLLLSGYESSSVRRRPILDVVLDMLFPLENNVIYRVFISCTAPCSSRICCFWYSHFFLSGFDFPFQSLPPLLLKLTLFMQLLLKLNSVYAAVAEVNPFYAVVVEVKPSLCGCCYS